MLFRSQNVQPPQPQFNQDKGSSSGSSMENKMEKFMDMMSTKMNQQDEAQKRMEQMIRNHSSSIHNLEVQMGQLANSITTRNQVFGTCSFGFFSVLLGKAP